MARFERKTMTRAAIAVLAGVVIILIVAGVASIRGPGPGAEEPSSAATETQSDPPTPQPDAVPEPPAVAPDAPTEPSVQPDMPQPAPDELELIPIEPPPDGLADAANDDPEAAGDDSTPNPIDEGDAQVAAAPPVEPASSGSDFSSRSLSSSGPQLSFGSPGDVVWYHDRDLLTMVVEYSDGTRFMLPRRIENKTVAFPVTDGKRQAWVGEGRVIELYLDQSLRDRLDVQKTRATFLAVLEPEIMSEIHKAIGDAGQDPATASVVIRGDHGYSVNTRR